MADVVIALLLAIIVLSEYVNDFETLHVRI